MCPTLTPNKGKGKFVLDMGGMQQGAARSTAPRLTPCPTHTHLAPLRCRRGSVLVSAGWPRCNQPQVQVTVYPDAR